MYALLESLYESVKDAWEDDFERPYGFWRGLLDGVVARYLDCGIFERGFPRIRCPDCAAEFAALLQDEVVANVGHAQWVFTVPKLQRPYFMHHRELLGPLCAAAWQTVRELMAVAAGEEKGFRPGMVAALGQVQTFGDQRSLHPTFMPSPHVAAGAPRASGFPCRTSTPPPPRSRSGTRSSASFSKPACSTRIAPACCSSGTIQASACTTL